MKEARYLIVFFLWNDDQSPVKAAADHVSFNALINNENSFTVSAQQQSAKQFYVIASWIWTTNLILLPANIF